MRWGCVDPRSSSWDIGKDGANEGSETTRLLSNFYFVTFRESYGLIVLSCLDEQMIYATTTQMDKSDSHVRLGVIIAADPQTLLPVPIVDS